MYYYTSKRQRLLFWQVTNNKTGLATQIFNLAEFLRDTGIVIEYSKLYSKIYYNKNRAVLNEFTIERVMRDSGHDATFEVVTKVKVKRNAEGRKTYKHVKLRSGVIA